MFRTVTVYRGERISTDQNWLVISGAAGENRLPIEDLYSVVIDNPQTMLTVSAVNRLTASGAHIQICKGSVRVLRVTERQYNAMLILLGEKTATEDFLTPADFIEL